MPIAVGIGLKIADRNIVFEVIDRGPGIDRHQMKRLFDPFYTTKQSGSGLGLYISRRIVTEMGGTLEIKSSKGSGSRVILRLPKIATA